MKPLSVQRTSEGCSDSWYLVQFTGSLFILFSSKCFDLFMSFLKDKVTKQRQYPEHSRQLIKQLPLVSYKQHSFKSYSHTTHFLFQHIVWLADAVSVSVKFPGILYFFWTVKMQPRQFFVHRFSVFPFLFYFFLTNSWLFYLIDFWQFFQLIKTLLDFSLSSGALLALPVCIFSCWTSKKVHTPAFHYFPKIPNSTILNSCRPIILFEEKVLSKNQEI